MPVMTFRRNSGQTRVALFPGATDERGAYLTLLREAITGAGVDCLPTSALTRRWVRENADRVDVVHLHWLEFLAPSDRTRWFGALITARRGARLYALLKKLRRRGVAIVWTIHNLMPHEPSHPRLERLLTQRVLGLAQHAIVHSDHAKFEVAAKIGDGSKIQVVPHGNYSGVYPPSGQPAAALRERYGLPADAFVYLSFGQVRRYKSLPKLISAFRELSGEGVALLIVGDAIDQREAELVRSVVEGDRRIHLDLRRVPAEEVTAIHEVSDAAVLAYDGMFSSGALLLALSQGLPVVVPASSTGTEIADPPAVCPVGRDGLTAALRAVQGGSQGARRQAALAAAARYDWPAVGLATQSVYRRSCEQFVGRRNVVPR